MDQNFYRKVKNMSFKCIASDPEKRDPQYPSGVVNLLLHKGNERLHGIMYTPSGKGPHPTILLLHGFPGYEQNLDLAQILRRCGFNVATFHYRGSWGSEGDFSFSGVLEDTQLAIQYLSSDKTQKALGTDPERMIIAGHSMGGFAALMEATSFQHIRHIISIAPYNIGAVGKLCDLDSAYREKTISMFEECTVPLKGTGVYELLEEARIHRKIWDLPAQAPELKDRNILLVGGLRDDVCEKHIHHDPLAEALSSESSINLTEKLLDDGHSFHDSRIALAEGIIEWLKDRGFPLM